MRPAGPVAAAFAAAAITIFAAPAALAAPAPCTTPQITDAGGDGHHPNTDIVSAWFSEQAGLQAAIKPNTPFWGPYHDDSDAAGFAMLYEVNGVRRYVRAEAPRTGSIRFDQGTWSPAGGFVSEGATTGAIDSGTLVIDVPAEPAGTTLARPFVLTYDGIESGAPHWVDRAPGGVSTTEASFGADLVTGTCGLGSGPTPAPGVPTAVTAVSLKARSTITGGGTVTVTGTVAPARPGIAISLRAKAKRTTFTKATTAADGTFSVKVKVGETTGLRATAAGISSQTTTVTVRSKVRVTLRRQPGGAVRVTGRVWPSLPGRVLWLRDGESTPSAKATVRAGRFRLRLRRPAAGRYQAVFIPSGARAERSTSNTGVIR